MYKQFLLAFTLLTACIIFYPHSNAQTDPSQPNILLVIADDMGTDITPGFLGGTLMPTTPFLDSLRNTGVSFTNCWAAPQCTPTRAAIMSGKYGVNTGVKQPPGNLDLIHNSIFKELNIQTSNAYDNALIGKWHISNPHDYNHPAQHEVDYYTGVFGSSVSDYYDWDKLVSGSLVNNTNYATSEFTDDAITWVNGRSAPWFLWLAHLAPHDPFHLPPSNLYSISPTGNNKRKYIASIEAMDTELRRLVANIPPAVLSNTIIVFIGDNGTPSTVMQTYPSGRGKGTIYQGGINVPLIVSGKGVTRMNETEDAMVNATDIFATVLEMTGGSLPGGKHNSYSFFDFLTNPAAVGRPYNYIDYESNGTGGDDFAIRDSQYKLLQYSDGSQEFFDLMNDPLEGVNLLLGSLSVAEQAAYDDLELEAVYIRTDWSCRDLIQNGIETSVDVGGTYCGIIPVCTYDNATSTTNIGCCDTPNGENEKYEIECHDIRSISTSDFPDHNYCYKNMASQPSPTHYVFNMDATPSKEAQPQSILNENNNRPNAHFGIGLNGVLMAPAPATPFIYENPSTGEYNWSWVFEPTNNQGNGPSRVALDCASAHTGPQGYHYHGNMFEYAEQLQSGISTTNTAPTEPLHIGWAADGYPVLYRFGPDGAGGLALLQPSFELRSGDRPGDGINAPCGPYNGKYTNDYMYTSGFGDLDECNGITRDVTLNTITGLKTFNYFYVITDNFPQMGRCHVGEPDPSFISGALSGCMVRMESQDLTLNNGQSITVGPNTYDQIGTYCDTLAGSNSCDSVIVTRITAILPLSLISFEALNRGDKWVDLLWKTADEINVSHFEIERSFDGRDWEKIGDVNSKGDASGYFHYQFQDDWEDLTNTSSSTLYYRLKIMDLDETFEYSNIKSVTKSKTPILDIIHDRNDNHVYLKSDINWDEFVEISILDMLGQKIQTETIQIIQGNQLAIRLDNLATNMYFVVIENRHGIIASKKIVVSNK